MNESTERAYGQRFERVRAYIEANLSEPMSVERLSQVAGFSKYHFHRQFSDYLGISVSRFIQLRRFRAASYRLAFEEQVPVIDIALDAGFESPEGFARGFKACFGQTPSGFRKQPDWMRWNKINRLPTRKGMQRMDVKIVDFPATQVAVFEHRGPMELVNDSVRVFIEWRKQSGLSPVDSSATFGIAHDNPETTDPARFRFDICGEVHEAVPLNRQGVVTKWITEGRCAVLRHYGSHDRIDEGAHYLYGQWLPGSGESLRDFPLFFHYLNLVPMTPEHELVTDLYLPLK